MRPARRPRRPARAAVLAAAVLAVVAAGCGDVAGDVDEATFRSEFQERTGDVVDDAVVDCLTDEIWERFDQGDVNLIYRAASEEELGDDLRDQLAEVNEDCWARAGTPADEGAATTEG